MGSTMCSVYNKAVILEGDSTGPGSLRALEIACQNLTGTGVPGAPKDSILPGSTEPAKAGSE
jgi:hypothetical protein